MRKLLSLMLVLLFLSPATVMAANIEDLQKQLADLSTELEDLNDRLDSAERHAVTDRINFYGDMRVRANSLHYGDVRFPAIVGSGGNPGPYDVDNDLVYTTRLRIGMKAKVWKNVSFSGRLSMYKAWGDSTGVQLMDSFATTMDGTNSGNTTGDWLHVERAYFSWKKIAGSNFYLSIGRRPSTYGPPSEIRENELRGGTPSGHLVQFNFDGATLGYRLGKITGVEGQVVRFCYGQGYDAEWGSTELWGPNETYDVDDMHLAGFNIDAVNDGRHFLQFTLFRAFDVTDGFRGLAVMPALDGGTTPNTNGLISRFEATENIGAINLGGVGYILSLDNGAKAFASFGWTQSDPNGRTGPYGGLLSDSGETTKRDGYSIYIGGRVPAPLGKLGLEYNWGSRYWTPFVQAQDDMIGPKLAARGHVGEAYYIFEINPKMFIKLDGLYYDYQYTGSGVPVGTPVKVDEVVATNIHGQMPVVDTAWDANISMTIKF